MHLQLEPSDTLLFREGRPFNQNDAGQSRAVSLFPPPPSTVFGGLRVALAKALGWPGRGDWSDPSSYAHLNECDADRAATDCMEILGTYDQPGSFAVSLVALRRAGKNFLPAPAHLRNFSTSGGDIKPRALRPSEKVVQTDAGVLSVLEPPSGWEEHRSANPTGRWLPADDVRAILEGKSSHSALASGSGEDGLPGLTDEDFAVPESRVGLTIDEPTRLAEPGLLYASTRHRLRSDTTICAEVQIPGRLHTIRLPPVLLGGESRFAFPSALCEGTLVDSPVIDTSKDKYLVYFATPVLWDPTEARRGSEHPLINSRITEALAALFEAILRAAQVPMVRIQASFQKRTLRDRGATAGVLEVAAGSVLFLEGKPPVSTRGCVGRSTEQGYGQYFIGVWPDG